MSDARAEIMKNIRLALHQKSKPVPRPDLEKSLYVEQDIPREEVFVANFTDRKGIFYYCENKADLNDRLNKLMFLKGRPPAFIWEKELLELLDETDFPFSAQETGFMDAEVGITLCECLVARTGSLLMSSRQAAGRRLGIYPPVHIVVASASQIVPDIKDGLAFMQKKYGDNLPSMISLVSGASRTADIEKTLVMGAHGPKELILFLIDDMAS